MENQILVYAVFNLFILGMLALDLGLFHRREHVITMRESLTWTAVWVVLALLFTVLVYYRYQLMAGTGTEAAIQFLTGYLIEKSLSVDNVFVFLLLFTYFRVPPELQHRVLAWGIIGALIFRAIFIALGAVLISQFHWLMYVFGVFLILTGIKMAVSKDKEIHPEKNPVLRLFKKFFPVAAEYHGRNFWIRAGDTLGGDALVCRAASD
jgi:tellurite resistance protein TerC